MPAHQKNGARKLPVIGQQTADDWPISDPTSWPDASQPNGWPTRRSGTWLATSGIAAEENPAKAPVTALAPKNCRTLVDSPISPVNSAMAKLERGSDNLPWWSATRPQTGEAKAVSKDVEPVVTPDQISMPFVDPTPNCGSE